MLFFLPKQSFLSQMVNLCVSTFGNSGNSIYNVILLIISPCFERFTVTLLPKFGVDLKIVAKFH